MSMLHVSQLQVCDIRQCMICVFECIKCINRYLYKTLLYTHVFERPTTVIIESNLWCWILVTSKKMQTLYSETQFIVDVELYAFFSICNNAVVTWLERDETIHKPSQLHSNGDTIVTYS